MRAEAGTIFLVEDDEGHARLIEKRLHRGGVRSRVVVMRDGRSALDYLLAPRDEKACGLPGTELVILDLNLPVVGGLEVLRRMKAEERTRQTPVIVITTSDSPQEIAWCHEMGCDVFLAKPFDYEEFTAVMDRLGVALPVSSAEEAS